MHPVSSSFPREAIILLKAHAAKLYWLPESVIFWTETYFFFRAKIEMGMQQQSGWTADLVNAIWIRCTFLIWLRWRSMRSWDNGRVFPIFLSFFLLEISWKNGASFPTEIPTTFVLISPDQPAPLLYSCKTDNDYMSLCLSPLRKVAIKCTASSYLTCWDAEIALSGERKKRKTEKKFHEIYLLISLARTWPDIS